MFVFLVVGAIVVVVVMGSGFERSRKADAGVSPQGTDLEHVACGGDGGEQGEEFALGG